MSENGAWTIIALGVCAVVVSIVVGVAVCTAKGERLRTEAYVACINKGNAPLVCQGQRP